MSVKTVFCAFKSEEVGKRRRGVLVAIAARGGLVKTSTSVEGDANGQGPEEQGVHQREHRRVDADPEGEREDGDGEEARAARQAL